MVRAETGKNSPTDSEAEKMFVKAVGLKKLGQIKEAESLLQSLIDPAELMEMKPDQYVRRAAMQQSRRPQKAPQNTNSMWSKSR